MSVMQIVALAVAGAALILVIRQEKPELAVQSRWQQDLAVFALIAWKLVEVLNVLERLAVRADQTMFSWTTCAYGNRLYCRVRHQICRDAGENALAFKVEMAGKVKIPILGAPITTILTPCRG